MILGVSLLVGGATAAAAGEGVAEHGFSARDLIVGLLSLVMALGGAYFAGMRNRLEKIEEALEAFNAALVTAEKANATALAGLQLTLVRDYQSKAEVKAELDGISRDIKDVHRRLDHMNFPKAPAGD